MIKCLVLVIAFMTEKISNENLNSDIEVISREILSLLTEGQSGILVV